MKVAIIKKGGVIENEYDLADYMQTAREAGFHDDDADVILEIALDSLMEDLTYGIKREVRREIRR